MNLELTDGESVIFYSITFIPLFQFGLGKGESFFVPFILFYIRLIDSSKYKFLFFKIKPKEPIGIKQMFNINRHNISYVIIYHFLESLVCDLYYSFWEKMSEIYKASFCTRLSHFWWTNHFSFICLQ